MGEKWLNAKFEERLAAYKHEQQKELQQLRFEIDTLMDRMVKLHQREFDVLPEAWARLNDACAAMLPIGLGFHQYPDVDRMSEPEMKGFLERSELEDWQKAELREATKKTAYYMKSIIPIKLWKADEIRSRFSEYLAKNGIFIPDPMKAKFDTMDQLMFDAVHERRLSIQNPGIMDKFDQGVALHGRAKGLMKSLEADVQARLWSRQLS